MFPNQNFLRKRDFVKAVQQGEPVVLWSPELEMPAINGVVTVESWSNLRSAEHWVHGRPVPDLTGWVCRVRVLDMRVVEVLDAAN